MVQNDLGGWGGGPWGPTGSRHPITPTSRDAVCRSACVYSRPGLREAHGQQHVQSGPMFDGARSGVTPPLPPRGHFGVQLLFSCHDSLLHRCVRDPLASLQLSAERLTPGGRLAQSRQTSEFTRVERKRVLKCAAVPKHSPGSELGRAAHIKSQPSAARSAIGSHRCSLGGPQCPDEVNMSGSGSPLTSGPRDEGRRAGGAEGDKDDCVSFSIRTVMSCL